MNYKIFLKVNIVNITLDYYHYNITLFETNDELDDYTSDQKYGETGYPRLCFAVIFNDSVANNNYDYFLRFNTSGFASFEIPPTNLAAIDPIKYQDYDKVNTYWKSGMLTV